jgi:hypothetical protein
MKEFGLERGKDGLKVYVMCEIPANVILAKEFSEIFDGFSIGSNDLTQLTLGVDRDSALVSHVYDEKNEAVKTLIRQVIRVAHENKRKVGICGQAPSDYPEFAEFLVQEGIDSISLNPDTVLKTRERIAAMEKKVAAKPTGSFKMGMASKLLLIFGVLGLTTVLGGYTCQNVNANKMSPEEVKVEVANQVAVARQEMKKEMEEAFEKERKDQKSTYVEKGDDLPEFTISYPSGWTVMRLKNLATFTNNTLPESTFSVRVYPFTQGKTENLIGTSTWNNLPVEIFEFPGVDNVKIGRRVIAIYPDGYKKSKYIISFEGTPDYFDQIFQSVKDFKIN